MKLTSSRYVPDSVIRPPSRTTIRSARAIVDNRWATNNTVVWRERRILSTASLT